MSDQLYLEKMRHSLSHIMAAAIKHIYAGTTTTVKFGVGPAIDNGFYYDVDFGDIKVSESDLKKIEKEMRKIIAQKLPITRSEKPRAEALAWAKENGQDYKVELIEDLPEDEVISFYTLGDFEDLCKGPHVENTGEVGVFKLEKVAGAYWRGDEKRQMLTRIYGLAFEKQKRRRSAIIVSLAKSWVCSASPTWLVPVFRSLRLVVPCYAICWVHLQIVIVSVAVIKKSAFRILRVLIFTRLLVTSRSSQKCCALLARKVVMNWL